jgi:hypothetical protein
MIQKSKTFYGVAIGLGFAGLLGGCQSGYRSYASKLDNMVATGSYPAARELAVATADKKAGDEINRVIYNLEAARAAQIDGDVETSIEYFARVHQDVRPYLDEKAEAKVTEGVATTAVNQATATFRGTPVDRIMATTLNSINHLVAGDLEEARVQLNLTRDWQEDAVRRYADEIARSDAKLEEDAEKNGVEVDDDRVDGILGEHYTELNDLRSYRDFKNPFASHLRGVFLASTAGAPSDLDRARFELREVVGMEPQTAPMVTPDIERIERLGAAEPTTWVYVLAGRGPWLDELRLDIPIPVGNVNYVSAAFPRMKFHKEPFGTVVVRSEAASAEAVMLADVESMVAAEFKGRLPKIITQEILSAALKAAITYAAKEGGGTIGQIIGVIYQAASTSADTRGWRTLPRLVLMARVPTPADGRVVVDIAGYPTEVMVGGGESHIVVVTAPSPTVVPSVLKASFRPGQGQGVTVER